MKCLNGLDKTVDTILRFLVGLSIALMIAVVTLQIIARYVLHISIGGAEEMPIFLMMICVWLAAPLVARADSHLKIELLQMLAKDKKRFLAIIKIVIQAVTFISLCFFSQFAFSYVAGSYALADITPGLRIPIWYMNSSVLISAVLMCIYYLVHMVRAVREAVLTWRS